MLTVPRVSSALACVVLESLFYGIYVILFAISIYLLLTVQSRGMRRERSIWRSPILCGGAVLFFTVTGHWVLTIDRLFLAFVTVGEGANPLGFYGDLSQATQIIQSCFLLASLATVDALFVHRLWAVWAHNRYVMIFPILTLSGLVVSSIGLLYEFSRFGNEDDILVFGNGWIVADCTCTVLTNIYCTVLIAWRLWRVQSILKPAGGRTFTSLIAIIVESAALSALWAIFFVATYVVRSNLRFLIDVTPPIVGSANMLIYVRVGLGWAYGPSEVTRSPATAARTKFSKAVAVECSEGYGGKQTSIV
ncbi:hypothetical protein C8R47DRAFT_1146968 [Mycena vitilis]|nr:hypothetical protein C8R47DRAFT_1146968 [Mycena vitilis]